MTQSSIQTAVTIALVGLAFALRFRNMNRERRLKLEFMWVLPLLLMVAVVFALLQFPLHGADWLWLGAILAVGSIVGWWRGKLIPIAIDPDTHLLNTKTSPAAILFLLGLFVVRSALRAVLESEASAWHLNVALITDGFIVLGVSLMAVSRIEMALRALGLLRQARAAKAAAVA